MPILKAAKKYVRVTSRRRAVNDRRRRALKETVKAIEVEIAANKKAEAEKMLPKTYKVIDKAVKAGVIKKNTGSRKKARITKNVAALA